MKTEKQISRFSRDQIVIITILAMTQFTVVLDFMVMSPMGDLLMKSMHLTTKQFGVAVSGYAFSAGISGFLTAGFADRFDRKNLLLFFYIGFIAGTLLCGLAHTYPMLAFARIVTGIFGGVIGSISMAIVADLFPIEKRGRVMGFMQMGFGASQVLGVPISLSLAKYGGWQSPFLMIVGLGSLIWITALIKLKPIDRHLLSPTDNNPLQHLWKTIQNKEYRIGYLATALLAMGGYMMMPWGSSFSINNLHISQFQFIEVYLVSGMASLLLMPMIGNLSDRIDKFLLFSLASAWMIIMVLIYTNLTPVPFWLLLSINIFFMVGIFGRMVPSMALVTGLPQMHDRGAFMSVNASLQQLSGGFAAVAGGLIVIQKTNTSPLEHYNILGIVNVCVTLVSVFLVSRVNVVVKNRKKTAQLAEQQTDLDASSIFEELGEPGF